MTNNKKGQAALEYLMTYGWAILVVVIVLAALFTLGVFNPPSAKSCTPSSGFVCETTATGATLTLAIKAQDSLFEVANVTAATLNGNACTAVPALPTDVQNDSFETLTLTCTGASVTAGSSYKGTVTTVYVNSGYTLTNTYIVPFTGTG